MIDRYKILSYISYDLKGPFADWEESKDDDGKFVLFADHKAEMNRLNRLIEILVFKKVPNETP